MCRKTSPVSAMRCGCGYEFGQEIADVLPLLSHQEAAGWVTLVGGVVCIGVAVALIIASVTGGTRIVMPGMIVIAGFIAIGRGSSKVLRSRRSTRELTARMKLPAARIVER